MPRLSPHQPISPITCREMVELVTAYLDAALEPRTKRQVDAHLAVCEGCRIYVEQIRVTVAGLAAAQLPGLPEDVCRGLVAAFRNWQVAGRE